MLKGVTIHYVWICIAIVTFYHCSITNKGHFVVHFRTLVKLGVNIIFFPHVELPTFAPRGVSLDISDEIATTRRQCKHLLNQLFGMVSVMSMD